MSPLKNKLTEEAINAIDKPGMYGDGEGLYLRVNKSADGSAGSRQWVLVYHQRGKRKEKGLGGIAHVSLPEARAKRDLARAKLVGGLNPDAGTRTFGMVARTVLNDLDGSFKNVKDVKLWRASLQTHAALIWNMPVDQIDTDDVLSCLKPIWDKIPETASRVRGRIERVLDAAAKMGLRHPGENPARWKGHLSLKLPPNKVRAPAPHKAMPYQEVPVFFATLRTRRDGVSVRMLELTILTGVRSGQTIGACRSEVDLDLALWTLPAPRTKSGKIHRVPLVGRALDIMREACEGKEPGDYLFPGTRRGKRVSDTAMPMLMNRMNVGYTIHGFRSSFRDWASEQTDFADDVVAAALAYAAGSQSRAIKPRDVLDKRRALMRAWDAHCTGSAAAAPDAADIATYTTLPAGARVVAVIAGLETYRPNPGNQIQPVKFARADAEAFAKTIKTIYADHKPEVTLLFDQDVTFANLRNEIHAQVWGLGHEDLFIFYYAGHGFHDASGNRLTVWDTSPANIGLTTLSVREDLLAHLCNSPCERVLAFIDACASRFEPSGRQVITPIETDEFHELMRSAAYSAVFLSCRPGQQSYPDSDLGHGVWTHFLLQALNGEAEAALLAGRFLTGNSLQDYLIREVPKHVAANPRIRGQQTPEAMVTATSTFAIRHVPGLPVAAE
jgi:integrase